MKFVRYDVCCKVFHKFLQPVDLQVCNFLSGAKSFPKTKFGENFQDGKFSCLEFFV